MKKVFWLAAIVILALPVSHPLIGPRVDHALNVIFAASFGASLAGTEKESK